MAIVSPNPDLSLLPWMPNRPWSSVMFSESKVALGSMFNSRKFLCNWICILDVEARFFFFYTKITPDVTAGVHAYIFVQNPAPESLPHTFLQSDL